MYFFNHKHKFTLIVIAGVLFSLLNISLAFGSPLAMQLTFEGDVSGIYTESTIKNDLPTVTGFGGFQNSYGTIKIFSVTKWKGVHLPLLLKSILGDKEYNVTLIAPDNFNTSLTKQEVEGGIRAFDETNTTIAVKAIPILAYEGNDSLVGDIDGPLRTVFVGENNQSIMTDGWRWVRQIVTIHVVTEDGSTFTVSSNDSDTSTTKTAPLNAFLIFLAVYVILGYHLSRKRR
jgi:hypothetical protein